MMISLLVDDLLWIHLQQSISRASVAGAQFPFKNQQLGYLPRFVPDCALRCEVQMDHAGRCGRSENLLENQAVAASAPFGGWYTPGASRFAEKRRIAGLQGGKPLSRQRGAR